MTGGRRIPVVLLTGFLGAGKTTALNALLAEPPESGARLAVVVNEFGSLNVDASLLAPGATGTFEINQGCLFCSCTQAQLRDALAVIATQVRPDWVLIEATGLAEPRDLASALDAPDLAAAFELRSTVCLVDPLTFPKVSTSLQASRVQVRAADVVLVNKCDLADEALLATVESRVHEIHPDATVARTTQGRLPSRDLLTGSRRGRAEAPSRSEPPEGFVAVSYESDAPVDRKAFYDLLEDWRSSCWRAKGPVLFADGPLFVELAGGRISSRPLPAPMAPRSAFVVILEDHDPLVALRALRSCESAARAG